MILDIDFHGGTPIYRQVMDQVRRQILTGQLAEGEQIEQVRGLAERLHERGKKWEYRSRRRQQRCRRPTEEHCYAGAVEHE